jgi:hypothetical protein
MKKFIPILFGVCAFVAYQIFFFCFINIIAYQACGARLSIQANILSLSLNISITLLVPSFFYFLYNDKESLKSNKYNGMSILISWTLFFFISWILASVIAATYDIYYGNQVNTIFEYFIGQFNATPAISGAIAVFLVGKFSKNKQ